jgi:hypothetical protein
MTNTLKYLYIFTIGLETAAAKLQIAMQQATQNDFVGSQGLLLMRWMAM